MGRWSGDAPMEAGMRRMCGGGVDSPGAVHKKAKGMDDQVAETVKAGEEGDEIKAARSGVINPTMPRLSAVLRLQTGTD